jgi:hypothetical protein
VYFTIAIATDVLPRNLILLLQLVEVLGVGVWFVVVLAAPPPSYYGGMLVRPTHPCCCCWVMVATVGGGLSWFTKSLGS